MLLFVKKEKIDVILAAGGGSTIDCAKGIAAAYNSDEFGKRLKKIRKKRGMTQERLAELLCLSVDSVSNYENGKTTCMPEHVTKICQILNISADYLYFGVEKELVHGNGGKMELITNILQSCSDFDLDRVYGMLQILLQTPAA